MGADCDKDDGCDEDDINSDPSPVRSCLQVKNGSFLYSSGGQANSLVCSY